MLVPEENSKREIVSTENLERIAGWPVVGGPKTTQIQVLTLGYIPSIEPITSVLVNNRPESVVVFSIIALLYTALQPHSRIFGPKYT